MRRALGRAGEAPRRASRRCRGPSKQIRPSLGSSSRVMRRTSVDLPQPDSPTRPTHSPARDREAHVVDRVEPARRRRARESACVSARTSRSARAVDGRLTAASEQATMWPGARRTRGSGGSSHTAAARSQRDAIAARRQRAAEVGQRRPGWRPRSASARARARRGGDEPRGVRVARRCEQLARSGRSPPRGRRA